jgi:phosphoribosyl 1,2-cyclic phosphodiesterase
MAEETATKPEDRGILVRFWGTRGSIPAPGKQTARFGGNTSCVEVRAGGEIFILDAGTGIRELGHSLLREAAPGKVRAHILFGHTHWDHIQGFPFFEPAYVRGNELLLYSHGMPLKSAMEHQFLPEFFPVALSELHATLRFLDLPDPLMAGSACLSAARLNHPGGAAGFRISAFGRSVVYMSDHEASEGADMESRRIEDFARDTDLLICDAQYTDQEYESRRGWGHSTFRNAINLALRANARQLSFFHHEPTRSDEELERIMEDCRSMAGSMACFGAREGMEIHV